MKKSLFTALFALASAGAAADGGTLTVTITDIREAQGHLLIGVEGSADGWNGKAKSIAGTRIKAETGKVSFQFPNLAPGQYAVQVVHDENDNNELDSNFIGIPSEGYGFSQNPSVMRRATFEEARFEMPAEGTEVKIRLR